VFAGSQPTVSELGIGSSRTATCAVRLALYGLTYLDSRHRQLALVRHIVKWRRGNARALRSGRSLHISDFGDGELQEKLS